MAKALVTGASSGIGEAFARHLANMGYDLIIVARREERLQTLAEKLAVDVQIVVADLTVDDDIVQVEDVINAHDDIAVLVNNAGFSRIGQFDDVPLDKHLGMIQLHITTTVRLTHAVIPQMKVNRSGAIIQVASFGGFLPLPGSATYNATKAYLLSFTESLHLELESHGIVAQVLCPGFTRTEIFDMAGYQADVPEILWMSSDEVVVASLSALSRKRHRVTPGIMYQIAWRIAQLPFIRGLVQRYALKALT